MKYLEYAWCLGKSSQVWPNIFSKVFSNGAVILTNILFLPSQPEHSFVLTESGDPEFLECYDFGTQFDSIKSS